MCVGLPPSSLLSSHLTPIHLIAKLLLRLHSLPRYTPTQIADISMPAILCQGCWAVVQVVCSRDVKVAGLLGSAASLEAKSSAVAEQQVGLGGTTKWRLASLVTCLFLCYQFTPGACHTLHAS